MVDVDAETQLCVVGKSSSKPHVIEITLSILLGEGCLLMRDKRLLFLAGVREGGNAVERSIALLGQRHRRRRGESGCGKGEACERKRKRAAIHGSDSLSMVGFETRALESRPGPPVDQIQTGCLPIRVMLSGQNERPLRISA